MASLTLWESLSKMIFSVLRNWLMTYEIVRIAVFTFTKFIIIQR